jgi:hypothetical protein
MENISEINKNQLEYGVLYNPRFKQALQSISSAKLHGVFLSHVVKFMKLYNEKFKDLQMKYTDLAKQYADLDEKGELKLDKRGSFTIINGKGEEWMKASQQLLETRFYIKKLPYQNLVDSGVKLSADDIEILEPILDGTLDS